MPSLWAIRAGPQPRLRRRWQICRSRLAVVLLGLRRGRHERSVIASIAGREVPLAVALGPAVRGLRRALEALARPPQ